MKGGLVADEMFPEGAGPYMDIDEVTWPEYRQDFRTYDNSADLRHFIFR